MRTLHSDYMHWAKTQPPVTYNLAASDNRHFRLDALPLTIADLDLDGASHPRYPPLVQAIARHHGVADDMVVLTDGTSMANMLALAALVDPGDEVLIEAPTYEPILAALGFLGASVRRVERRADEAFRLAPEDVAASLTNRTRLIVLTNLHNPSGVLTPPEDLHTIGAHAAAIGARVLVDEVYLDAIDGARTAALLGPQFLTTGSLTKVYGLSGLRCGWVLAEPALAERIWRLNDLFVVNRAHQAERLACIAFDHLDTILGDTRERLATNRAALGHFLAQRSDLSGSVGVGLTAFPRWDGGDTRRLDDLLRRQFDTGVVPGHWFEHPDRMRIGLTADPATFAEALHRLAQGLDAAA